MRIWWPWARCALVIAVDATKELHQYAKAGQDHETGGLLLGYRADRAIMVVEVVEVRDADAAHGSYTRRQAVAQAALDMAVDGRNQLVGYVGDWHSHPAPVPPSKVDRHAIRRVSRQYDQPVALLVHAVDNGQMVLYGIVARRGRAADCRPQLRAFNTPGS